MRGWALWRTRRRAPTWATRVRHRTRAPIRRELNHVRDYWMGVRDSWILFSFARVILGIDCEGIRGKNIILNVHWESCTFLNLSDTFHQIFFSLALLQLEFYKKTTFILKSSGSKVLGPRWWDWVDDSRLAFLVVETCNCILCIYISFFLVQVFLSMVNEKIKFGKIWELESAVTRVIIIRYCCKRFKK